MEIEIGSSTNLDDLNYFLDFVDYDSLNATQTSYTFFTPQPPGTYYVHVGSVPATDPFSNTQWSDIVPITIPAASSSTPPPPPPPPAARCRQGAWRSAR